MISGRISIFLLAIQRRLMQILQELMETEFDSNSFAGYSIAAIYRLHTPTFLFIHGKRQRANVFKVFGVSIHRKTTKAVAKKSFVKLR